MCIFYRSKKNRDIASLSNTELKEFISEFENSIKGNIQIIDKENGKLGKTKNKEDLNSAEFIKIKNSFKMKEKFIDVKKIAGVGVLVIIVLIGFIKKREKA